MRYLTEARRCDSALGVKEWQHTRYWQSKASRDCNFARHSLVEAEGCMWCLLSVICCDHQASNPPCVRLSVRLSVCLSVCLSVSHTSKAAQPVHTDHLGGLCWHTALPD